MLCRSLCLVDFVSGSFSKNLLWKSLQSPRSRRTAKLWLGKTFAANGEDGNNLQQ